MKRSEIIQIISNYIYELNVDSEDCDEISDKILTAIEKAGMLPPYRQQIDEEMKQNNYPEIRFHTSKWESE